MLDVPVPQVGLQATGIDAFVRKRETTGVPHMWGWTGKPKPAATPRRAISLRKPAAVNGALRSDVKMKGETGSCSRLSRRKARSSRPDRGWTLGDPLLARFTCRRPWAKSTQSH